MKERFERVFTLKSNQYLKGSPVIIEAGALLKDTVTSQIIAQLKFKNISKKEIISLKVSITAKNTTNEVLGEKISYTYLDLFVKRDESFGSTQPIVMPDKETRKYDVYVTDVVFADETVWKNVDSSWIEIENDILLQSKLNEQQLTQFKLKYGNDMKYIPHSMFGIWKCSCGRFNLENEERCHFCNKNFNEMLDTLSNPQELENEYLYNNAMTEFATGDIARMKKAISMLERIGDWKDCLDKIEVYQNEIDRKEKIKRESDKKRTRILGISAAVLAICILTALFVTKVMIPNQKYNAALEKMEKGDYKEAMVEFEAMDGYKDSNEKIEEIKKFGAFRVIKISALGKDTLYAYDDHGNISSISGATNTTAQYTYSDEGKVLECKTYDDDSKTSQNIVCYESEESIFSVDPFNQFLADSRFSVFYNEIAINNIKTMTVLDSNQKESRNYYYNEDGYLTKYIDSSINGVAYYTYKKDDKNRTTTCEMKVEYGTQDPYVQDIITISYDEKGYMDTFSTKSGQESVYKKAFDEEGRLISFEFDCKGVSATSDNIEAASMEYDKYGNVSKIIYKMSDGTSQERTFEYEWYMNE